MTAMRTRNRMLRIVAGALLGVGVSAACGGGDSGGGGDVTTGIAPSKLLADITPSEAEQACERLQAGFLATISPTVVMRTVCTLLGAAAEDTAADCATARDACIQEANQEGSETMMNLASASVSFECGDGAVLTECNTTVGQLETCFNDTLDQIAAALGQVSCDDAASVSMDDFENFAQTTFVTAPSCENIDCGEDSPFGAQ
jgi:hypothetical protein